MLSPKQEKFCKEYLKDANATQAAIRCRYSKKSARTTGYKLLRNPEVKEKIQAARERCAANAGITEDAMMEELKKCICFNIKSLLEKGNKIKDITTLPDEVAGMVESIQVTEVTSKRGTKTRNIKIKTMSKLTAIEMACKLCGFFSKDNKQKGQGVIDAIIVMIERIREARDPLPRYEKRFATNRN